MCMPQEKSKINKKTNTSTSGRTSAYSKRGAGLDFIVLDECAFIKEQTWAEVLRPTLTERKGGALFISTPKGYNWFQRIYEEAENRSGWDRWQLPTTTNPYVPLDELEIAKEEIGSFLYSQEYEAQFVSYEGVIFYAFTEDNVQERPILPNARTPLHIFVDFNIN